MPKFRFPFIKTSKSGPKGKVTSLEERREVMAHAFSGKEVDAPNTKARNWIEFVSDFKLTRLIDYDSYMKAGTGKLWASHLAVSTIAKAMVAIDFQVKMGDKLIDHEQHPLGKILREPNPFDSWQDLVYTWPFHIKYTGNAYWMKDEINGKGQPSGIYPLLPQFVEIVPDRKTRVNKYVYRVNGRVIEVMPEEMIHFRNPHPGHVIFGLGDLEAGEPMFEDYINRNKLERHYLSKGGVPSGVLVRKEEVEDPDEWRRFTNKWKEEYEGIDNSGKTAFLNGDWNYVKLGLNPTELQTMERSKMTIHDIFTLHGVPLSVAGVEKAANYATAKQDSIHFKKNTIIPMMDMLCQKLNSARNLTRTFDSRLSISYELGGLEDIGGIISEYAPLVDKGAMTRNELRRLCSLEEIKDNPMMDEFLVTQGLVPIEMAGSGGVMGEDLDAMVGGLGIEDGEAGRRFAKKDDDDLSDGLEDNDLDSDEDKGRRFAKEEEGGNPNRPDQLDPTR